MGYDVNAIKNQMAENAAAWHTATPAEKKILEARNQALGRIAGGTYNSAAGTWSFGSSTPSTSSSTASSSTNQPQQSVAYTNTSSGTGNTASTAGVDTAKAARLAAMQSFTGWDNDPQVRSLQEADWAIFIDTGRWDSAAQQQLHIQAEQIRMYNNPMYTGSTNGPANASQADQITPRDTTPILSGWESVFDQDAGGFVKLGIGAVAVMIALSFFKG